MIDLPKTPKASPNLYNLTKHCEALTHALAVAKHLAENPPYPDIPTTSTIVADLETIQFRIAQSHADASKLTGAIRSHCTLTNRNTLL